MVTVEETGAATSATETDLDAANAESEETVVQVDLDEATDSKEVKDVVTVSKEATEETVKEEVQEKKELATQT